MAADKPRPTLADYVTIVLSPALIMAMIVSLVFFLLTILYRGEFTERLHHIFFFFIFGMVLVARISMESGVSDHAPLYGGVLAVLAAIALGTFVTYPAELVGISWLINAGLIGMAWWLSYRLTYSCTYIDEKAENTGTGVLQAAGLEETPDVQVQPPPKESKREKKLSWWERYQRFRAERKKTQPPGVWVVYFALAALPIFGLGQSLIDVGEVERRNYTFWLMTLYVGSSLGLLVTTAFLGLRRYLRQRRLEMPNLVTTAWLAMGAVLLVVLLTIGAILPRPQAEFSALSLARLGSKEIDASKHALNQGDAGKGEGQPGKQEQDPKGAPVKGKKGDAKDGKGEPKGADSKGNQKDTANDPGKKADDSRQPKGKPQDAKNDPGKKAGDNDAKQDQPQAPPDESKSNSWLNSLSKFTTVLKWIVFGILAFITVVFVLRGGLRYLANFTDWARRLLESLRAFWERLFGAPQSDAVSKESAAEISRTRRVPFDAFANPFLNGRADEMTPVELVRYSFEALEAWAIEHDCGRGAQETPIEFTQRMANEVASLDKETKHLGSLYARVLYARGVLSAGWRDTLEEFWKQLDAAPTSRHVIST
jgi:hypothetical protein